VRCLYCGKDIGAFRLLRDSEFCSALHRKKYGVRLGKALNDIAAPEPAPAGIAGFRVQMPFQQGNLNSTLVLWQTVAARKRIRNSSQWKLTIDSSDVKSEPVTLPKPAPIEFPPLSQRWMAAPPAEPVAAFVETAAALSPSYTLRVPRFASLETIQCVDTALHVPAPDFNWMPAPAPEPVTAFVQASAAAALIRIPQVLRFTAGLEPALLLDSARHAPALDCNWMSAPAPESVAAFVQPSAALAPVRILRLPCFAAELESAPFLELPLDAPTLCEDWFAGPAPEPVTAFVQAVASLSPAHALRLPRFTAEREPTPFLDLAQHCPSPRPEVVAAFVQTVAALAPALAPLALRMEAGLQLAPLQDAYPETCTVWMPDNAVCGLPTDSRGPVCAPSVEPAGAAQRMSAPEFTADLGPFQEYEPLEVPAMCTQWIPSPAADPVFSFLHASIAPAIVVPAALKVPVFSLPLGETHVPWIAQISSIPQAEPVAAAVYPSTFQPSPSAPLILLRQEVAIALPEIPQVARQLFEAARPASPSAPEAVESLLIASQSAMLVSMEPALCRGVEPVAPTAVFEAAPAIGGPAASPAPAALESLLVASFAAFLSPAIRMPRFELSAGQERTAPNRRTQPMAMAAAAGMPDMAAHRLGAPQPIATLAVAAPPLARSPLDSALPRPGLLPIEFHAHRERSAPAGRPEWKLPRPALLPPSFLLSPALEKLEDPAAQQKTARKEPVVVEILNMPTAKRPPTLLMVFFRVAAGFLLAVSLWYGMANFRGDRRLAVREVPDGEVTLSADAESGSAKPPNGGAPVHAGPKGPVGWVKQTIARRAALKIADNFHDMENWDSATKTRPDGWSRHADGYMNTGALALFRPTLKFNDYRMEFFGQIETKSIGWTVRATDSRNYHAMKLTVVEAGIRPFVALVHFDVVNGKSGHRTQTPLNIMVHNDRPIQFAVDVRGNRFVTSIDGEEVDSFIDNTLVAGGVGFFSEAGERARLYWMRVSRNDDWLGHVCAMLADGAAVSTAELQTPELPGGVPPPGLPDERDGTSLAAMWIGLPYLGATRQKRISRKWRCEPWNT
jgi:hypothetical protein